MKYKLNFHVQKNQIWNVKCNERRNAGKWGKRERERETGDCEWGGENRKRQATHATPLKIIVYPGRCSLPCSSRPRPLSNRPQLHLLLLTFSTGDSIPAWLLSRCFNDANEDASSAPRFLLQMLSLYPVNAKYTGYIHTLVILESKAHVTWNDSLLLSTKWVSVTNFNTLQGIWQSIHLLHSPQQCAFVPLCVGLKIRSSKQLKANLNGASACPPFPPANKPYPIPSPFSTRPLPQALAYCTGKAPAPVPVPAPRLIQISTQRCHNHLCLSPCAPAPYTYHLLPSYPLTQSLPRHYHCVNA